MALIENEFAEYSRNKIFQKEHNFVFKCDKPKI